MRTCEEYTELMSARLDGGLTAEQEAELEEHLRACPACAALWADLAALHGALPGLWEEPPADLIEKTMARIRAEADGAVPFPARPGASARRWRKWGAMAAVMAVAFAGALHLYTQGPPASSGGNSAPGADRVGLESAAGADRPAEAPSAAPSRTPEPGAGPAGPSLRDAAAPAEPGGVSAADARESAAPGQGSASLMLAPTGGDLTPEKALRLLYEEQFAQDYPDAEYTCGEGFEGYTLTPLTGVEGQENKQRAEYLASRGLSGNGAYFLFELYTETVELPGGAVSSAVLNHYAVPLSGDGILVERGDLKENSDNEAYTASRDAFWSAVNG